ncbi:hypothetical protein MLD38_037919 [Melastoma candidum]|uniref:Uncharacterized protein n=1 Tax=Melastoma candidum TaxID=119954 RepID=A0ACB9KY63_9MYRT|nr:hypothetical protein MLD38_037919 [Melastoma candidum]
MVKGTGLYTDIGKKARDLLYKDYVSDHKFTLTTYTNCGIILLLSADRLSPPAGSKKATLFSVMSPLSLKARTSLPTSKSTPILIPYQMHRGMSSQSWNAFGQATDHCSSPNHMGLAEEVWAIMVVVHH